jgi:hypothetical protein
VTRPFRLEEDERRYFALRSEFFIRLVQSGVPAQTVHDVMRNFGKLEDAMFFEGVRQGMVVSLLADTDQQGWDAVTAHVTTYGDAATPLTRVEESDPEFPAFSTHPWLAKEPMQFGPLTLTEAIEQYGADIVVKKAPAPPKEAPRAFDPATSPGMTDLMVDPENPDGFDPMAALEALANGEDPAKVLGRYEGQTGEPLHKLEDLIELQPDAEPTNQPALLDRIRDILLRLDAPPQTWKDLILMLMREVRHDAGFLDDLMSTPMGMTVISQAKLFHLHPGAMPEVKPYPAVGYGPDPNKTE